jgi:hypothetical protein
MKPPTLVISDPTRVIRLAPSTEAITRFLNVTNLGGADRDRTGGLLVANQALSQLSYSPLTRSLVFGRWSLARTRERLTTIDQRLILVGLGRVELPTSPLSGVRSSHLSYRPGWLRINQNVPEHKKLVVRRRSIVVSKNPRTTSDKRPTTDLFSRKRLNARPG